jgi:hypothetical protein
VCDNEGDLMRLQTSYNCCLLQSTALLLLLQVHMSPAEASTKGLAAELASTGQAAGAHILCPVPHVAGEQPVRLLAYLQPSTCSGCLRA